MSEDLAGLTIGGRYTLERVIGQGGMGAVYLAHDAKFDEPVALKLAVIGAAVASPIEARFQREARIGYRLGQRTGFVRAFDWGRQDHLLYLAMDLVPGARELPITEGEVNERLALLIEAGRLVADAHSAGVVHRDLKPSNLLLGADGVLRLSDFGLAKMRGCAEVHASDATVAEITLSDQALGTPPFMPPEQFEDAKSVDERADVYALGVMLFQALSEGGYPFEGRPIQIVRQQQDVLAGRAAAPRVSDRQPDVPPELEALCARSTALEADERTPSAQQWVDALSAYLRPQRSRAPKAKTRRRAGPEVIEPLEIPRQLERGEAPGEYVNPRDGSVLVWIPPGEFRMGCKDAGANEDESPLHRVALRRGLFLGKHPVTWRQFRRACTELRWVAPSSLIPNADGSRWEAEAEHPVFHVTWQEAHAYAAWAGLRLPTESEWEYAARYGGQRRYPWGDEDPRPALARCEGDAGHPARIGSHPAGASPWGAHDLIGNVWEWVFDWYERYSRWVKEDPVGPAEGSFKVIRGGSWSTPPAQCRASTRRMFSPLLRAPNLGFRVCCHP